MKLAPTLIVSLVLLTTNSRALGPQGHRMVGAIADRLIEGEPVADKVDQLLGGLSLAEAATLPDEIKSWDGGHTFHLKKVQADIQNQLVAFFNANKDSWDGKQGEPRHHVFHYTDVPVEESSYDEGKRGRSQWDIVHMIPFCIEVLQGQHVENEFKITTPIALILLAHYLGDIHQPLHVGAEYFDISKKQTANGDTVKDSLPDAGGNTLKLQLHGVEAASTLPALHGFWDNDAVSAARRLLAEQIGAGDVSDDEIVEQIANNEPAEWKPAANSDPTEWVKDWVKEILPLARKAHKRLAFGKLKQGDFHGETAAFGIAAEKPDSSGVSYEDWAAQETSKQLSKAGWRLAYLIKAVLK